MIFGRSHSTFIAGAATILCSVLVAEFAGYWLHRLLHSDKFPILSRGHMIHHLLAYGPGQPMRTCAYREATLHRFSVGNVGLEWIAPSAVVLLFSWAVMLLLGVAPACQVIALCTLIGWPVLMFSYLHDGMHVEKFWMSRVPVLRAWFLKARRRHDIHHRSIDSQGLMDRNFGIGFYFFDRLFRTLAKRHRSLNWKGYRAALKRHRLDESELRSLRNCSQALFHKPD